MRGDDLILSFSLLLAEDREVNITFRMCLEVGYKAVGTLYDVVQIVVERRVAHQFTECSVGVLYLCHHDWWQEEKGMTEDEMAGWHHCLDGHESE